MRIKPTRKCSSFANVEKFSDFRRSTSHSGLSNGGFGASNIDFGSSNLSKHSQSREPSHFRAHSNFQYQHRLALIQAHGDWLQQWLDQGWDGYLFTFLFNQLPGSRRAMVHQMHQQLERWYGMLATRIVRKPRSPGRASFLPKGVFVPDLPVPKRCKVGIGDVSINDGLHVHGIVVANRWARMPETLDVYFQENLKKFLVGKLRHIDVELIRDRPRYTVGYALKGLKRPTFSEDDVLVLPRAVGELPDRRHLRTGATMGRGLINAQP
jgi:hypothetical protein